MITVAYLVLLLVIVSELNVIKGYDNIFPVDEVSDCKTRVLAAAQKKCRTNKVCKDGSIDMIQECGVLGYNLIFQDSTYDLNSDFEVYDAAHCAIKSCIEGMQSKAKNIVDLNLSGIADSLRSCLVAVKDCAKPKIKWHKYEL